MLPPQKKRVLYSMEEDPFPISMKFKKEIPLTRNIFELNLKDPKNYLKKASQQELTEVSLLDPFHMNMAITKFLLLDRLLSWLSLFSVLLSILIIYAPLTDPSVFYFSTVLTVLLLLLCVLQSHFQYQNEIARMIMTSAPWRAAECVAKMAVVMPHATAWTIEANFTLHLFMLLRLLFPLCHSIRSSVYFDSRASRLLNIYGMKPEVNFFFACKVLLNEMHISIVLTIYAFVVILYSHCLYLAQQTVPFIDCFEVVIVTLPTIGYGEYQIQHLDRIIVLFILVTGVALNAFVTLSLLKQFQMTTRQNNAYILLEKLRIISEIEDLSTGFIVNKIKEKKFKKGLKSIITNEEFRQKYMECKSNYRQLKPQETQYLFNYFKESLEELRLKAQQIDNMLFVLLTRLAIKPAVQRHKLPPKLP